LLISALDAISIAAKPPVIVRRRKEIEAQAGVASSLLVNSVNEGVAVVYANQKKLDEVCSLDAPSSRVTLTCLSFHLMQEAKKLQSNSTQLLKQSQQWVSMLGSLNAAVKVRLPVTAGLHAVC
jgi:hypothetical protein